MTINLQISKLLLQNTFDFSFKLHTLIQNINLRMQSSDMDYDDNQFEYGIHFSCEIQLNAIIK